MLMLWRWRELQLVKVALGLVIGAYFVWWSLEVLQRLPLH
jgi:hypothetical protein